MRLWVNIIRRREAQKNLDRNIPHAGQVALLPRSFIPYALEEELERHKSRSLEKEENGKAEMRCESRDEKESLALEAFTVHKPYGPSPPCAQTADLQILRLATTRNSVVHLCTISRNISKLVICLGSSSSRVRGSILRLLPLSVELLPRILVLALVGELI